jgi:hypothetical protein
MLLIPCALVVLSGCGPRLPKVPKTKVSSAKGKTNEELREENESLYRQIGENKAQMKRNTEAAIQRKCYWTAGIATFAFFVCVALAIFVAGFRKYAVLGALASVAICALALLAAAFVEYLIAVGCIVAFFLVCFGIYYWRADEQSRDQIVFGFNKLKGKVEGGYKDVMKKYVSPTSNTLIDKVRARYGLD